MDRKVLISAPYTGLLTATKWASLDGDTWLNFDAFQSCDTMRCRLHAQPLVLSPALTRKRDSGQGTKRRVQRIPSWIPATPSYARDVLTTRDVVGAVYSPVLEL